MFNPEKNKRTIFITIGVQAGGKTTFCRQYLNDFAYISLDIVKTRSKEDRMITGIIPTGQNIVIDNTNPTKAERAKYLNIARQNGYKTVGLYFRSAADECIKRNSQRENPVPLKGLLATAKKLEQPSYGEGFDELYYIKIENNQFIISEWKEEP